MKIQFLSDLHLEFERSANDFTIKETSSDVIVLAGDIGLSEKYYREWIYEQTQQKPTVVVLGNHEFYGQEIHSVIDEWRADFQSTYVYLLENVSIEINGVLFAGATLWTINFLVMPWKHMHEFVVHLYLVIIGLLN